MLKSCNERSLSSCIASCEHILLTVTLLGSALAIAVNYRSVTNITSIVGGGCGASFMFAVPLLMTLLLKGRSGPPASNCLSPQIGSFLGVTKQGAWIAALLLAPCVIVG